MTYEKAKDYFIQGFIVDNPIEVLSLQGHRQAQYLLITHGVFLSCTKV